jgi:GAF domain-containing protein
VATPPDLAAALAHAAARVNQPASLDETLDAIVRVARDSMPGVDHAGITLSRSDGRLETAAATDDLVLQLDAAQYEVREGPCVTAIEADHGDVVVLEHAARSESWPAYVERAVPLGLRSAAAVRLFAQDRTVGVLNLYSLAADTVDPETRTLAELFAIHAAYAYGHRRQVSHLERAMETRELIANAVGMVMERFGLDRDRAFEYLVRVSASSQLKLRVVAERIIAGAAEDASA